MIVNPKTIVERGIVTDILSEKEQVQPNGIDLRIDKIWDIPEGLVVDFTNEKRKIPEGKIVFDSEKDEFVVLNKGGTTNKVYSIQASETMNIPPDMAAVVLTRSTLLRGGAFIVSALWDSGYKGKGKLLLSVPPNAKFYKDAKFGQIVFFNAESASLYIGKWQGEGMEKKDGVPVPSPFEISHMPMGF